MITKQDVSKANGHRLIAYYLQAGWLYESCATSIMSDETWDWLCTRLDMAWESLPNSEHKQKIDRDALPSATAMYLTDSHVPLICQRAAMTRAYGAIGAGLSPRPADAPDKDKEVAELLAKAFG